MRTRVLPPEEWERLEGTQSARLRPYVKPEDMRFVVLEDDGKIVGAMAVMKITHLENLWLDPSVKGSLGASRMLMRATMKTAQDWANSWVMASVGDDTIADMVTRVGGKQVPVYTYVLPVE